MDDLITDLQVLIRQPSISATNHGLKDCAFLLSNMMNKAGIKTELLYLQEKDLDKEETDICSLDFESTDSSCSISPLSSSFSNASDPPQQLSSVNSRPANIRHHMLKPYLPPPLVFGEVKSKSNPNGKTILFYNHYDVQPIDPIENWNDDPFSGKIEGNMIFGRGSCDDKGELITRLKAVEFFLKHTGDVPCNIKFVIEGEEEIGSPNLYRYLAKYKERFSSDIIIWESGYVDNKGRSIISLGQKGIMNVELKMLGPCRDVHSSLAVVIENPAWKLIRALSLLTDKEGKILIEGWYDEVKPINDNELKLIADEPFEENAFKREYGIDGFLNGYSGIEVKKSLAIDPTCNINGLFSGYTEEGVKTIIPSFAIAKIDFRLVPYMDPKFQFNKLVRYLRSKGYSEEELKISFVSGEAAYRTPMENKYVNIVVDAAKKVFNDVILNISSPGTGPVYVFKKILGVDSICIGNTILPNKMHSPNEFTNIDLLNKGTKCFIEIIKSIAKYTG